MKYAFIIFVALGILAKDIASISWDIWFMLNQQEVTETLCENKDKVEMQCNGKCYLSKQLQKVENQQNPTETKTNPFSKFQENIILYFKQIKNQIPTLKLPIIRLASHYSYENTYHFTFENHLLKPPLA